MSQHLVSESLSRRFHVSTVPSLDACGGLRRPIVFSHVASPVAMRAPTLPPPVDDVFAVHVHHLPISRGDIWIAQRHRKMAVPEGGVFIFDLRSEPTAQILEPFDFSRFEFPKVAMDDLAYQQGLRRLGDLYAQSCDADPVVEHIAIAMMQRIALFGREGDSVFQDHLAMALFSHLARKYGGAVAGESSSGVLAPWQLRRVDEWIGAHLQEPIAIAALAAIVELSPSYFSRAFTRSAGMPPHQWLLHKRIDRAKLLLRGSSTSLSDIAASCGFVDQSHFTKVFARVEHMTPGRWRRWLTAP